MKVIIKSGTSKRQKYEFINDSDSDNDSDDNNIVKNEKSLREKPSIVHTATLKRYDLDIKFDEKDFYKEHFTIHWDNVEKVWYWKGQISKIPHGLRLKLKKNHKED